MTRSFRQRILRGERLLGTLLTLPVPEVAEILCGAGFDWFFIDLEHSPMDVGQAQGLLQAVGQRAACLLRVPLNDEIWIKKALDIGPAGVIVPLVNTAEATQRAVRLCKYPPQGSRSVGIARAQGYGLNLQEYLSAANQQTAVVVQVEHIQAVQNIQAILAVEGVDAVLAGPYDLSASMGLSGQVESEQVQSALAQVRAACQQHGKPLGIFATTTEAARRYTESGYTLLAVSTDALMLGQSGQATVRALREE